VPDPPTVEEIVAVIHAAADGPEGVRLRILVLGARRSSPVP
jgi:hypothetical protein